MFGRVFIGLLYLLVSGGPAAGAPSDVRDEFIPPFQKATLENGLTVIVNEDHKVPLVAVSVWYHAGSRNEKRGKTGLAHLVEHLMFKGSVHHDADYFGPLERSGGTQIGGETYEDRTVYSQVVPTPAFALALWLESDRMESLGRALTQKKLDEARRVIENERRQADTEPYAVIWDLVAPNSYPESHPYSWRILGLKEDLDHLTVEDVQDWLKTYYGAANAVLVLAGDVNPQDAMEKARHYFGGVPSGPPQVRLRVDIGKRYGLRRLTVEDRVPQARVYMLWNTPEWGSAEGAYLELVSRVLAGGKTSRLLDRLVRKEQSATEIRALVNPREIGGQFIIIATAKPGTDLSLIEMSIQEEIARFIEFGPTPKELARAIAQHQSGLLGGLDQLAGFGSRSHVLALGQMFGGSPDFQKTSWTRIQEAAAEDLRRAAEAWLAEGAFFLEVQPFPDFRQAPAAADRAKLPLPSSLPKIVFPKIRRAHLANGLDIILVRREAQPVVHLSLLVDAGFAADQMALPGTAHLVMDMLDEGTASRSSLEIGEELEASGARLSLDTDLDVCRVTLTTLKSHLEASLDVLADVLLHPSFPEREFERIKGQTLAAIEQEKASPIDMARRVLPGLLYGKGHAYGNSLTGTGTRETIHRIQRENLVAFYNTWFKPNNCKVVVAGDIGLEDIIAKLDSSLREWKRGAIPRKKIDPLPSKKRAEAHIIDIPGAPTTVILAAMVFPPMNEPPAVALACLHNIIGGSFSSRLNLNLREEKNWSYAAGSMLFPARSSQIFFAYGLVQKDKTKESMIEISKEIQAIGGSRPPQEAEIEKFKTGAILGLPASWETLAGLGESVGRIVGYHLPDDYYDTFADHVRALSAGDVQAAANSAFRLDRLVWLILGDGQEIEKCIQELGFDVVHTLDPDGDPLIP